MSKRGRGTAVAAVLAAALLAGCAPGRSGTYTILDTGDGPVLCEGGVRESWPPSCDGPGIIGWDWDAWPHEDVQGVRMGEYSLIVTPDGDRVRVAVAAQPHEDGP